MIKPTIGRIVWFTPSSSDPIDYRGDQPLAAIVTYVWGDRMVNLGVFDANGNGIGKTSVTLVQEGDERPALGHFCEWMPYQKAVAAQKDAAASA